MKKRAIIFVFASCIMFLINGIFAFEVAGVIQKKSKKTPSSSPKTTNHRSKLVGDWKTELGEVRMKIFVKDGKPIIKQWSQISGLPVEVSNYSWNGKNLVFDTYFSQTNYRNHYHLHLVDNNTLKGQSSGSFTNESVSIRMNGKSKIESCYKQILTNKILKQKYEIFVCYSNVLYSRLSSGKSVMVLPMYIKNHIDSNPLYWMNFKILIQTRSGKQVENITLTAKKGDLACNYVVKPGEIHIQQLYFYPFMHDKIQKVSVVYQGNYHINLLHCKDCRNIISEYKKSDNKPKKILKIVINSNRFLEQAKIDFDLCASHILQYAGFIVMDNPPNSHGRLEINAKLSAIRFTIDKKLVKRNLIKETYTYSGAKVSGHLRFSEIKKKSITREFSGKVELGKNHNASKPSGAPFYGACTIRGSFAHQLIQLLSEQYGLEFLIPALTEKNRFRHFVIEEIMKSETDPLPEMIALLKTDDWPLKRGIMAAIGKLKDRRATEPLLSMLEEFKSSDFKTEVIETLGQIGDPRAAEPLKLLLKHKYKNIRQAAIGALSNIKCDRCFDQFISLLKEGDETMRVGAARALGTVGNTMAIEPLLKTLNDPAMYIRKEAALSLTKLGWKPENQMNEILYLIALRKWDELKKKGKPAIEPLIKIMGDKDNQVRINVMKVLKTMGKKALPNLIEAVGNSNQNIRWGAVRLLGNIESPTTIEPLISALSDKDEFVRDQAFRALSKQKKDTRMINTLIDQLKHLEYQNRKNAAQALEGLKWTPQNEEQKINFLIAKEDIKSCLNLGRKAIDPLIHALLEYKIPKKLQSEIGVGLSIMLGNKFYSDKSKWKKWWEEKHNPGEGQKKGCFSTFWTIHVHAVFKGKMGSIFVTPNKQAPSPSESNGWEDSVTYNLQVYGKVKRVKIGVTLAVAGGDGIKRKDIIYIDGEEKLNFSNTFNQSCMNFGGSKKYEVLRNRSGTHPIKITHKIQLTKNGQPVSIGATQLESKVSIPIFRQVK